jgi:hypothetical protein
MRSSGRPHGRARSSSRLAAMITGIVATEMTIEKLRKAIALPPATSRQSFSSD